MFKKILVPIDLMETELTQLSLTKATEFAGYSTGDLRLLNVQSLLPATFMEYVPAGFDLEQMSRAETALADIAKTISFPPTRMSTIVRMGGVYPEVLAEAKEWGADLILIGSRRPSMSSFLLGSNAKAVVSHATCSVMVVRG